MTDNFSEIISCAKEKGKLIFKNFGMKSMSKTDLRIPINDIYYIDLCENKFINIPDVISQFIYLEVLLCSHNMIRSIPSSINNISYLEVLDLSCNHLTALHPSVCRLQYLKILVISSNRLVSLPSSIGRLSLLEEFDSSCNSLTCLPDEFSSLHRLKYLNLRHNKLLDVPTNLHKLDLEELDLSENQLTAIPSEYRFISTLKIFNLSGNPLSSPPANVCSKGLQHIIKYLQSESKRQQFAASNTLSTSSHGSIDYHQPINNNIYHQSEPSPIEINGTSESITVTSSNSQHSLASESVNINDDEDQSNLQENSVENVPPAATTTTNTDLKAIEESVVIGVIDGHYRKNQINNVHSSSKRTTQNLSPSIYRSSRYVSSQIKQPTTEVNAKSRRNSLPSNERSSQRDTDGGPSSQCVVLVDSNNDGRKSSTHSVYNQSNNSHTHMYAKNVPASPLRVVRPKFAEFNSERKGELVSPKTPLSRPIDTSHKIHEKIRKFHKIVEAQLHVHIDSKRLSQDLSNGIYLCHLANILVPHCISTVHTASPGQQDLGKQKAKRNLDNFLEACRRNGVAESCLFNARDVMNSNSNALLHMAEAVDALIESIRVKKTPSVNSPIKRPSDHIDWHGILNNPGILSNRVMPPGSSRSSFQGYSTVGRTSKPIARVTTKVPKEDIIHYASEV